MDNWHLAMQESQLPMFQPTDDAVSGYGPFIILAYIRNQPDFELSEFLSGCAQGRKYMFELFTNEDFDALERMASEEVVTAFRRTHELYQHSRKNGLSMSYKVDRVDTIAITGGRIVIKPDEYNEQEISMFERVMRWMKISPLVCFLFDELDVPARLDLDVEMQCDERFEIRKKDNKLVDCAMKFSYPVVRNIRFSRDFLGREALSPWYISAIL